MAAVRLESKTDGQMGAILRPISGWGGSEVRIGHPPGYALCSAAGAQTPSISGTWQTRSATAGIPGVAADVGGGAATPKLARAHAQISSSRAARWSRATSMDTPARKRGQRSQSLQPPVKHQHGPHLR